MKLSLYPLRAVSLKTKRRSTWASALPFLPSSACRASSLVGVVCTMSLTSMRGSMTISTEGGPERSCNGP